MRRYIFILIPFFVLNFSTAQDFINQTFKDTRVVNSHTIETVDKGKLDVRIGHRFGDLKGGWETFYGFESAQDVLMGAAYGVTNNMSISLFRTKGAGSLKRLINGTLKFRFLNQKKSGTPLSMTAVGISSISTMGKTENTEALNNFPKISHRMIYSVHLLAARKFSDRFSLQIAPGWTHRNVVPFDEENDLISLGLVARFNVTKVFGIIGDFTYVFSPFHSNGRYYPAAGIGFEIDTGGHVFQLNFTNAKGIMETDYIPYTSSNWLDAEFRLGFTISRLFNL